MKRNLSLIVALMLAASNVQAQTPTPTPQQPQAQPSQPAAQQPSPTPSPSPAQESDEDVVRITSNLVQFDVVVTDKQGRLVTDLRPEDFEVRVEGKPQEITNLSFISNETGTVASRPAARPLDKSAPPLPPVPLREGQVHRTIALVVDDLGTSFESLAYVRKALRKFVDEQMQPGDLVAIMRTSAGMGALQQFTTDKNMLYRAIERVRWNSLGRSGVSAFAPMEPPPPQPDLPNGNPNGGGNKNSSDAPKSTDPSADLDDLRDQVFSVGTLGAVNFIVRGMDELPGRKSVIMFTDGFSILDRKDPSKRQRVLDNLRHLIDLANRASVVIYTVDARGLPVLGLTAADNTGGGMSPEQFQQRIQDQLQQRSDSYHDTQDGPRFLAEQTGGLFIHDNNDLGGAVRRVLDDQRGYYLIGFRPDQSFFDAANGRRRFNKFEVKVKREGLKVRTRAGFYGYTEGEARPVPRTRSEQMLAAISSPFKSGELNLHLTSLFNSPGQKAEVVDSLMHIDMKQFKFTDEADGWKHAVIDVIALTFGEDGRVVDEINRTENIRARGEALRYILENGVVYGMKVPIKKPGAYQLRVAVRDALTEKLGSASQFIEVPDLKKDRLVLSGIFLMADTDAAKKASSANDTNAGAAAQQADGQAADGTNPLRDASVRRFRQTAKIDFLYNIYNARVESAAGRPQLQTQIRLFHEGRPVFEGAAQNYDAGKQTDMARLQAGGRLQLGSSLQPGEYVLQVIVTDALSKGKQRTATQWIDFEIVK